MKNAVTLLWLFIALGFPANPAHAIDETGGQGQNQNLEKNRAIGIYDHLTKVPGKSLIIDRRTHAVVEDWEKHVQALKSRRVTIKTFEGDAIPLEGRRETKVPELMKGTEFEKLMKKFREMEWKQKLLDAAAEARKDAKKTTPKKPVPAAK